MSRAIKGIIAVVVIAGIAAAVWQWNLYEQKLELREEALLYFEEEDYSKTIRYLESALEKNSILAGSLDNDMTCYLTESYYQLEDYAEAENIYDTLLKENNSARYYQLKGRCAREAEEYDRAVSIYMEGWENTGETDFLQLVCEIYVEQEQFEQALEVVQQGISAEGDSKQEFMYLEVIIYEKSQDYSAAYEAVCAYCDLYPEDDDAQKERTFLSTRI
ncbi:MAG: tetratricopeptide repeat protein [Clostridiales bacterium]|nr:tetratricopeptide repeat protein [Clostridiales bacterium]